MNIDRALLILTGSMVLLGMSLGTWVHPSWYFLPVFVGLNQIQAALTGFCPAVIIFRKIGIKSGCAFPTPKIQKGSQT